ncbi:MAG: hypothetical protein IPL67_19430 [Ignavibacteria bacterium]|nr:hypothetical protein [Ignavibacteria bacterium]
MAVVLQINDNGHTEISGAYPFRSPCDLIVMWDSSKVIYLADGVTGSGLAREIFKSVNNGVNWTKVYTNGSQLGDSSDVQYRI